MSVPRRVRFSVLVVVASLTLVPGALAAGEVDVSVGEGGAVSVGSDPSSGRSLVVWGQGVPDGHGYVSLDLHSRVIDEDGSPAGPPRRIGGGAKPSMLFGGGGQMAAIAADSRRQRHLVAWAAHKPGMGRTPCSPAPPVNPLFGEQPACAQADTEIFIRLLDRHGRPLGNELKVSNVGPPDSGEFFAASPTLAYDERSDSYLLIYTGALTTDQNQGALFVQRIKPNGYPDGPAAALRVQPQRSSHGPATRLAADPRGGFLLVYSWGATSTSRGLFAQRLTAAGKLTGTRSSLPTAAGGGAGSVELAFDRRRRRALLVSSTSAPGSSGYQAQQLRASGAPATAPVTLNLPDSNGAVLVASDPRRGGWSYGFGDTAPRLVSRVYVQRANAAGRPLATPRLVTAPDARALEPRLSATPGGTLIVAWSQQPINCAASACTIGAPDTIMARLIRP